MTYLPRNGQYELFTYRGRTHCFDEPGVEIVSTPEMFAWLRSQPEEQCRPFDHSDVAFYLTPNMYLIWKLRWAYEHSRV
jgi:hypothetical protein